MKFLLVAVNAKYIHSNLGVYSLKAYAEMRLKWGDRRGKEGFLPSAVSADEMTIEIGEYTINNQMDMVLKDIYRRQPDVLGFSCYIWNIDYVMELVHDIHKVLPGCDIWLGGPEVSYDAGAVLRREPAVTGIMKGEGEETFARLMEYYVNQDGEQTGTNALAGIAGLAFRGEEGTIRENPIQPVMDMSQIPFSYGDLTGYEHKIIYYESSRGCPFSCSYCLSSIDKSVRFRDLELVKRELAFFLEHRVPQVKFVDRTFNCKKSHAMAIWQYLLEHDNGVTNFHFEISADLLDEEELSLIERMRPGLIQLEIGVQSTNPDTIRAIHRTMNFEKLAEIVNKIHSFKNIHQHLDLIAGLPYEDYDSFHRSFNDVYALRPQQLQLGFLKVLKGSHMKEMTEEYGIVYKELEPYEVLGTKWLPYEDILRLKMVESMVELYYNSGQFQNTIACVEPLFEDAFTLYERLGQFYEKKGYSEISHSRMRRYEILLEFVKEELEEQESAKLAENQKLKAGNSAETAEDDNRNVDTVTWEKVADSMIYDLYLRENLKSHPSFEMDQKPYEKAVWEYRRLEKVPKTAHIEVFRDGRILMFDYENRDPLLHNAAVKKIQL